MDPQVDLEGNVYRFCPLCRLPYLELNADIGFIKHLLLHINGKLWVWQQSLSKPHAPRPYSGPFAPQSLEDYEEPDSGFQSKPPTESSRKPSLIDTDPPHPPEERSPEVEAFDFNDYLIAPYAVQGSPTIADPEPEDESKYTMEAWCMLDDDERMIAWIYKVSNRELLEYAGRKQEEQDRDLEYGQH